MKAFKNGQLLRVFVDENNRIHGKPLYELIIEKAQDLKLAGATVLRGIMGYGGHSQIHTTKILRLSEDLPLVIEIVDSEENIQKIIPFLDDSVKEGLITLENIRVIKYRDD